MPNLFIPGAAKAGTSALHSYLAQHPGICMSSTKEPHYLWREDRSLDDYAAIFHHCTPGVRYLGESSTSYLVLPSVASRIAELAPEARLIFMLRNPVDRAWSHYWWARGRYRAERRSFREAFLADQRQEVSMERLRGVNDLYYHGGRYGHWLAAYWSVLSREQTKLVFFEDFVADPANTLDELCRFLDLPPFEAVSEVSENRTKMLRWPVLVGLQSSAARGFGRVVAPRLPPSLLRPLRSAHYRLTGAIIRRLSVAPAPSMTREDRDWARSIYAEDVVRLQDLIGRDLAVVWPDFPGSDA